MALKDMIALVDDKLADVFHTRKPDAAKLRAPVLKAIERTRSQFSQGDVVRGPKWFKSANGVVAFTPTLRGGHPLQVNGQTTVFIAADRFPEFLDHMQAAVQAGEFDGQLAAGGNGAGSNTEVAVPVGRGPRDPNAPRKAGWTDERRARYHETMAARRAAKTQQT